MKTSLILLTALTSFCAIAEDPFQLTCENDIAEPLILKIIGKTTITHPSHQYDSFQTLGSLKFKTQREHDQALTACKTYKNDYKHIYLRTSRHEQMKASAQSLAGQIMKMYRYMPATNTNPELTCKHYKISESSDIIELCEKNGVITTAQLIDWGYKGAMIEIDEINHENTGIIHLHGKFKENGDMYIYKIKGTNDYKFSSVYRFLNDKITFISEREFTAIRSNSIKKLNLKLTAPASGIAYNDWADGKNKLRIHWENNVPVSMDFLDWGGGPTISNCKISTIDPTGFFKVNYPGMTLHFKIISPEQVSYSAYRMNYGTIHSLVKP